MVVFASLCLTKHNIQDTKTYFMTNKKGPGGPVNLLNINMIYISVVILRSYKIFEFSFPH